MGYIHQTGLSRKSGLVIFTLGAKSIMSQAFDVAVLGATGLVGQTMIELLEERDFPVNRLYPLASKRSAGSTVSFKGEDIEVLDADDFDWSLVQFGFFSAGGSISAKFAPLAAEEGCIVIDNTSEFRYEPDIPLVVPEVNAHALAEFRNRNIIANPNCSTIQMLVALKLFKTRLVLTVLTCVHTSQFLVPVKKPC